MIIENQKINNLFNMENIKFDSARTFSFELELPKFDGVLSELQETKELTKMLDCPDDQLIDNPAILTGVAEAKTNLLKSLQDLAQKDKIPVKLRNVDDIKLFINSHELFGLNEDYKINMNSLSKEDIDFFKLCTEKTEITINDISAKNSQVNLVTMDNANQISYKSVDLSKGLFNLIEYSFKQQKPIRIDFQGNSSVILRLNSKGGLIAEFISNDAAMDYILRSSLPNLKNKLDSEGISYEKIFYRDNSEKNKKKKRRPKMRDSFVTAINTQTVTKEWMNQISVNLTNIYTPGYREISSTFANFLDGSSLEDLRVKTGQGKAIPGTSDENVYLEGQGFFVTKTPENEVMYTRLGEFTFNGEGVYKTKEGYNVQGYLLNDKGEIQAGTPNYADPTMTKAEDNLAMVPTTDIKLWIDPKNGKYLGKYEEFKIEGDGVLYGKADGGKIKVPLYKLSVINFHNPASMTQTTPGYYVGNEASGKPVVGRGEIRSGLIEMSNTDLKANITHFQQAKMQMEMASKLITTNKQLLEDALRLLQ